MINNRFKEEFEVYRQEWIEDQNGFESSELDYSHEFKGLMQQTSPEDTEFLNLSFNQSFTIFCPLNTDIKSTDIVLYDGWEYGVRNIIDYTDGINKHKQVYLEKLDEKVIGS